MKEIKYVFDKAVNNYTCHSLFATITNNGLLKLNTNAYSKQPQYKVSFLDRVITIIINEEDIKIVNLPSEVEFNNQGSKIKGFFMSKNDFIPIPIFMDNDFVLIKGTISYAIKKTIDGKTRNISPITPKGNFVEGTRKHTLDYLSKKTGLRLLEDTRDFRFEFLSYKNFELKNKVYSKSNNNVLSLQNVFYLEISGYVENKDITNELIYTSIGKKRDYGFGNLTCKKI